MPDEAGLVPTKDTWLFGLSLKKVICLLEYGKAALSGGQRSKPHPSPSPKRQGGEKMQNSGTKMAVFRLGNISTV